MGALFYAWTVVEVSGDLAAAPSNHGPATAYGSGPTEDDLGRSGTSRGVAGGDSAVPGHVPEFPLPAGGQILLAATPLNPQTVTIPRSGRTALCHSNPPNRVY